MAATLRDLIDAIVAEDPQRALKIIADVPSLARAKSETGATHETAQQSFFEPIGHYVYVGDTALHMAAAAYRREIAAALIAAGADVSARNRRGATPLHYAADGVPGSSSWDPDAQAATAQLLLDGGADPNDYDDSGVTPLHRAVRNRCAAVVSALLDAGGQPFLQSKSGSTALDLAQMTTGRGGSGSPAAKAELEKIRELLRRHSQS
jgi:hypothetical protein